MLAVNQLIGFGAGGKQGATSFSIVTQARIGSSGTTGTFSTVSIGSPAADRYVLVFAGARGSGLTLSMTMDGTPMAQIASAGSVTTGLYVAMFIAFAPAGTTATFVLSTGTSSDARFIAVNNVVNLEYAAARDSAGGEATSAVAIILSNIDVPAGGIVVGGSYIVSGTSVSVTWTALTEDSDSWAGAVLGSIAHTLYSDAATVSPSVTGTNSGGANHTALAVSLA